VQQQPPFHSSPEANHALKGQRLCRHGYRITSTDSAPSSK
jgi:hypothetical protein